MAKFCYNCGKELNDNADICLNCGVLVNKNIKTVNTNNEKKNNGKGFPVWAIILIVLGCVLFIPLVLLIILGFLFSSFSENSDRYIEEVEDFFDDRINNYDVTEEGTIGSTLTIDGVNFTLDSIGNYSDINGDVLNNDLPEGYEYLVFFLTVENVSSDEKLITYLNFNGNVDDEKCLPKLLLTDIDGVSYLSNTLEVGETAHGYVAFEVRSDWEDFDLNYRDFNNGNGISFYVTNENIEL